MLNIQTPLFPLQVVTPTGIVFDDLVEQVTAVDPQGEFGVLANHINFIASLVLGKLSIKQSTGEIINYIISDGFVRVYQGAMTITTTKLEPYNEPNLAEVIAERMALVRLQELEKEMELTKHTLDLARKHQSK